MFVISWRNPTAEHRDWGLEQYVKAIDTAIDAACAITSSPDASLYGSCSGGMSAAAYLGWAVGKGRQKIVNATWSVCILDSEAAMGDSTLGLFNSPSTIEAARAHSRKKGVIEGDEMAAMFAWLRPNDLIWNYWVNNYLLGNKPPAYDVLAWNADTTRLSAQYHSDLLDMCAKNPYMNPGSLVIDGVPIDLSRVEIDAFVTAGITAHITPWRGCYGTARMFGPGSPFVLPGVPLHRPRGGSRPAGVGEEDGRRPARRQLVAAVARMDAGALGRAGARARETGLRQIQAGVRGAGAEVHRGLPSKAAWARMSPGLRSL